MSLFTLSNFTLSSSFALPSVPANVLGLEHYRWTLLRKIEFIRKILWDRSIKRKPGDVYLEIYRNQGNHRGNFKIVSLTAKRAWCSSPTSGMNPAISGYLSFCPLLSFKKKSIQKWLRPGLQTLLLGSVEMLLPFTLHQTIISGEAKLLPEEIRVPWTRENEC